MEAAAGEKGTLVAQEQAAKAIAKEALHGLFAAIGSLARGMVVAGNSVGEPFGQRMEAELIVEGESSAPGMDPSAVQATDWLGGGEADTCTITHTTQPRHTGTQVHTHTHKLTHLMYVLTVTHSSCIRTNHAHSRPPSLRTHSHSLTLTRACSFIACTASPSNLV